MEHVATAAAGRARNRHDLWAVALVARVAEGDSGALAELYDRYSRPVYALARRVIGDATLAEDVVQEVFLAVWRQPGSFRPEKIAFSTWLLSAVHNKAVDVVRKEEVGRRRADALAYSGHPAAPDQRPPDAILETLLSAEHVRRALGALPAHQREALTLAYFGGYTQSQISALTGAPLGTVKTRMHRAMSTLRDALGDATEPVSHSATRRATTKAGTP